MEEPKNPKSFIAHDVGTRALDLSEDLAATKSTRYDARDMARMGHKQELIRHFNSWKSGTFVCVALLSWELAIFTINQGLIGGGRAGLIWSYIWNFIGFIPVFLTMAEMSSMAPVSGSQYHWVSEFAPEEWQKGLSYFVGWMSVLAWQAGNAYGFFVTAQLMQGLIEIGNPDYVPQTYHTSLLTIAVCVVTYVANYWGHEYLPKVQYLMFVGHIVLFFILIVAVAVVPPKATSVQVWTDFRGTGWDSIVLGALACQVSGISGNCGSDTAGHIAEEVEDASYSVPRVMLSAYFINAVMSIASVVVICYAMPDLSAALADITMYPAVYVLRQTMSEPCLIAFISLTIVVVFCGNVNYMVAVSRDLWAFARDNGTPFPSFVSRVSKKKHIPAVAIALSCICTALLSLLYIGSSTAYYAIVSLFLVAILACYQVSISCLLWRRIMYPATLPSSRFSLGRGGVAVNVLALIWSTWAFFWSFWPLSSDINANSMNWSVALFGGVLVGAGVLYVVRARHIYRGPVALVAGRKGNAELDTGHEVASEEIRITSEEKR